MTVRELWCACDNWTNETMVFIHHEGTSKPEKYEEISYVLEKYGKERVYLFWVLEGDKIALLLK